MSPNSKGFPVVEIKSVDKLPDLDEAIEKCEIGKYNYMLIAVSGCLMSCAYVGVASITYAFPVANCDLNYSTQERGVIGSIGYVGFVLASYFWGYLSDTRGRKTVLIPNLYAAFLITVISSFVTNFWLMLVLRFLHGCL